MREARARQRRRQAAGAAALTLVAVAVLSVWAAIPAGRSAKSADRTGPSIGLAPDACRTSQLRISFPLAFAATGHEGGYLRFTNVSRAQCLLVGWPTVAVVKSDGQTVRVEKQPVEGMWVPLIWPHVQRMPRLVLRPGQSGIAEIQDGDVPVGNSSQPCLLARALRIAAPGDRSYVTISARLRREATYLPLCYPPGVSPIVPLAALPH
jgi:hypothetical protein